MNGENYNKFIMYMVLIQPGWYLFSSDTEDNWNNLQIKWNIIGYEIYQYIYELSGVPIAPDTTLNTDNWNQLDISNNNPMLSNYTGYWVNVLGSKQSVFTLTNGSNVKVGVDGSGVLIRPSSISVTDVTAVYIGPLVTSIGIDMLANATNLTSITFDPDSRLTSIGNTAFSWAENVASITPLPESVTEIGEAAFRGLSLLKSVVIPPNVTSIGARAFYGMTELTSINIPYGIISINPNVFGTCQNVTSIIIPPSVTSIEGYAFGGMTNLTSINIPDGVTSIGEGAFNVCKNLTSITIPSSVTSIGDSAFQGDVSLNQVIFDNLNESQLTSIGQEAFQGTTKLGMQFNNKLIIPPLVTSIGSNAFQGSGILWTIVNWDKVGDTTNGFPEKVSSWSSIKYPIGGSANVSIIAYQYFHTPTSDQTLSSGWIKNQRNASNTIGTTNSQDGFPTMAIISGYTAIETNMFYPDGEGTSNLTEVIISPSVTSIGSNVFKGIQPLKVTFDNISSSQLRIIGDFAFQDSTLFSPIPEGVTSIGQQVFNNAAATSTSITIPLGLTTIGQYAFSGTTNMNEIIFKMNSNLSSIADSTFTNTGISTIIIPSFVTSIGSNAFPVSLSEVFINSAKIGDTTNGFPLSSGVQPFSGGSSVNVKGYKLFHTYSFDELTGATAQLNGLTMSVVNGYKSIGASAFANSTSLTSIILSEALMSIGDSAFKAATSLTSIIIPASVTSIGDSAFNNAYGLTSITFAPNSQLHSIGESAFGGGGLTSITIPFGVTRIEDNLFNAVMYLTSVTIPNSVVSIGDLVFDNALSFQSISIPSSVTSIGPNAFSGSILSSITIFTTSLGKLGFPPIGTNNGDRITFGNKGGVTITLI